MRRHEFQAPLEKEGNNGVWGAMAGYSFTAMHQFSCGSSQGPSDPHCLFACHIQPAWPFCSLSVHIYIFMFPIPCPGALPHTWYHVPKEGVAWREKGAKVRILQRATSFQSKHPPWAVEVLRRDSPSRPGSAAWLEKMTLLLGNWSPRSGSHSWLTSGWRNRYVKSKQFLSGLRTACGSRSKARCGGVITAVETTFWHLSPMNTLKQSYSAQVLLRLWVRGLMRTKQGERGRVLSQDTCSENHCLLVYSLKTLK